MRVLLLRAALCALALGLTGPARALPPGKNTPTRIAVIKSEQPYVQLNKLLTLDGLTEDQRYYIRYLLDQQQEMIGLFSKYGLLSPTDLQAKCAEILDVTRTQVDLSLTASQKGLWEAPIVPAPLANPVRRILDLSSIATAKVP